MTFRMRSASYTARVSDLPPGGYLGRPTVKPRLPPPDPNESLGMAPAAELDMLGPTAVFPLGSPGRETERLAKQILDLRPGALIVVAQSDE